MERIDDAVEVVNYNAGDQHGLTAHAQIINLDGTVKWNKTATLDTREDSTEILSRSNSRRGFREPTSFA